MYECNIALVERAYWIVQTMPFRYFGDSATAHALQFIAIEATWWGESGPATQQDNT